MQFYHIFNQLSIEEVYAGHFFKKAKKINQDRQKKIGAAMSECRS
jgi:hypothetical protein